VAVVVSKREGLTLVAQSVNITVKTLLYQSSLHAASACRFMFWRTTTRNKERKTTTASFAAHPLFPLDQHTSFPGDETALKTFLDKSFVRPLY
jgi:hypothetical protein